MTPVQPPTHDEIEAVAPVLSALVTLAKWIVGPSVAAWIVVRFVAKNSIKVGEARQQYLNLASDVEAIKQREKIYITIPQHDAMQKICTATIENRTHHAVAELRYEMSILNGNICKIMGALDIIQDYQGPQQNGRRKDDK